MPIDNVWPFAESAPGNFLVGTADSGEKGTLELTKDKGTVPETPEGDRDETSHPDLASREGKGAVVRKVPAVPRAIAILRLLSRSSEPLGVNRIARELDLVPSTALHILRALIVEELVSFDDRTKRYTIDMGILNIARSALRRNTFVNAVQPELDSLSDEFNVTMLAAKVIGLDHAVVVAVSPSSLPIRLDADLGSRFPALISATGRCIAAFGGFPKSELKARFAKLNWATPMTFEDWWEQVEDTKRRGYGVDESNFLASVTIMAVPVFEHGELTHSIVAVGLQEQFSPAIRSRIIGEMQKSVSRVVVEGD